LEEAVDLSSDRLLMNEATENICSKPQAKLPIATGKAELD
jgi:hypothetical protein